MKAISAPLLAMLQSTREFFRYDLISIELPNGEFIYASTCPVPVTYEGNQYHASMYGVWERGAVTSEVANSPKSGSMSLSLAVPNDWDLPPIVYPGTSLPIMQAIPLGLFDAAEVWVYTFYTEVWEAPQVGLNNKGVIVQFGGVIASPERTGRSKASFKVMDMLYLLNLQFPVNVISTGCPWNLYDDRCTLNRSLYGTTNHVAAGSSQVQIICETNPTVTVNSFTFTGANEDYTLGRILFTTGQNKGLSYFIKEQSYVSSTAVLAMSPSVILAIADGDEFTIYPGCNKTVPRCNQFVNIQNFGGQPFVPNPEAAE